MAFENNPWSEEFWNLTEQGRYIKQFGPEVAKTKARQAGARLGDLKPNAMRAATIERHWILSKKIIGSTSAGGGSSGSGPPQ